MSETELKRRLDRLHDEGRTVDFWLRDDDTVEPTPALEKLLQAGRRFSVPTTLAVIPEMTGDVLAFYLGGCPMTEIVVHGWSHRNHAGQGEKKQELGAHRPPHDVLTELHQGLEKLQGLHGTRFSPMLVPPWNRISPAIIDGLPAVGFTALSTFGPEKPAPLAVMNSHVDIIDWHGNRGGRAEEVLMAEIVALIDTPGRKPVIGILTHHLVHDDAAWAFLDRLFALTADHPACRWRTARQLLDL